MKVQIRSISACLCCASLLFVQAGCEDAAARQREEVQQQLAEINRDLQKALASASAAPTSDAAQSLNAVVTRLSSITEGGSGQQASKSMLSATALRELAMIAQAKAASIEADHSARRTVLGRKLDASARLAALATGMTSLDPTDARTQLQQQMADAQRRAEQLAGEIEQLRGPIETRTQANAQRAIQVEQLRLEIGQLIQKAQELGPADGFETYKQAAEINRQADRIQYEISNEEVELDYSLVPQHEAAERLADQLHAMIEALLTTQNAMNSFAQATSASASETRSQIDAIMAEVTQELHQIRDQSNDELNAAYEEALAALTRAASQADAAARSATGDQVHAARVLAARVRETLGQVHWNRAKGLEDHAALLARMAEVQNATGAAQRSVAEELTSVSAAAEEAIEQAKAAFTEAQDILSQVGGRGNQAAVEAFRNNLDSVTAVLSGQRSMAAASLTSFSSSTESTATGAESPEAIVAMVQNASDIMGLTAIFDLLTPIEQAEGISPDVAQAFNALRTLLTGTAALDKALQAQFGRGVADIPGMEMLAMGAGDLPKVQSAHVESVEGDRGSISITDAKGETNSVGIVRINGRWFIDASDISDLADMDELLGSGGAADPQAQAMMTQFIGMFQAMGSAMHQLAQDVQNGQFSSFDVFVTQSQQRMQQMMMQSGGFGGMPGM